MTENSYTNLYDAIELAYRREPYAQEHFYFSDLGKCFRMRILKRLNIPQYPMDNRGLRVCTMGNQIEKLVINALVKAKILRKAQIPIYFGEFSGRLDAEVIAYEDTRTIECKSIHSGGFHYMLEDEPPHRHYIYQVIGYGLFRGNPTKEKYRPLAGELTYRYFMPVRKQFWWVGNTSHLESQACLLAKASGILNQPQYLALAFRQLEWILGANPFGACLMTGEGMNNPFPHSRFTGLVPGGIMNGIGGNALDQPVLDMEYGFDWRTTEYWAPHNAWYLWAVSELEKTRSS